MNLGIHNPYNRLDLECHMLKNKIVYNYFVGSQVRRQVRGFKRWVLVRLPSGILEGNSETPDPTLPFSPPFVSKPLGKMLHHVLQSG